MAEERIKKMDKVVSNQSKSEIEYLELDAGSVNIDDRIKSAKKKMRRARNKRKRLSNKWKE